MKILVTGFEPFGGESINPASLAVQSLADEIDGARIMKLIIPTATHTSLYLIKEAMLTFDPDVVLSIGQAGGRCDITVERVGINILDFHIADNDGNQYIDEWINKDGPAAHFSNLPMKVMVDVMQAAGVPSSVSNSAGTFVCNYVLYGVCDMISNLFPGKRSGFIHIPYLPEQVLHKAGQPSMELSLIVKGLTAAIKGIIEVQNDIRSY